MEKDKSKTGVAEWAAYSVNIQVGCEHNCLYCYARGMACQYGQCTREQWPEPVIDQRKVDLPRKKFAGVVMSPTTHDITPRNLSEYLCVLRKLLDAGNQVLIVSKPHLECIKIICEAYREYQKQILFRFTIGSPRDDVLKFWEPGAPSFGERMKCLREAYSAGFATSISCEPFLDNHVVDLYHACAPFLTDSFWVGKMNKIKHRVDFSKISEADHSKFVAPLLGLYETRNICELYQQLKDEPFIQWKDSVREVIENG